MNILFLHYSFKEDGITRSVLNNIKGLKELPENINFILAGDSFVSSIPLDIEKRYIDWNAQDLVSQIKEVSKDADVIIIENPTIGTIPKATLAFKEFSESNSDKKIIYRTHDFIDDRPYLFKEFKKVFNNFEEIYPTSNNVSFLTLTSFDKKRLIKKGLNKVNILPNSIVADDFHTNPEKSFNLRKIFEMEGIINPNEKMLTYPVRVFKRKNIEEAMLLTKILNEMGENYRLIVTVPFDDDYKKEIEILAEDYKIQCSIGKASKYISFDEKDSYTISDLYSASDLVVSTSIREGFGFALVEPWLAGIAVIGRKLPTVTEDFEENGIDLSHLYDNNIIHNSDDSAERMENVKRILSNPEEFQKTSKTLGIKDRIQKASEVIDKNREVIKKYYNHVNIARQLLNNIKS